MFGLALPPPPLNSLTTQTAAQPASSLLVCPSYSFALLFPVDYACYVCLYFSLHLIRNNINFQGNIFKSPCVSIGNYCILFKIFGIFIIMKENE